MIYQLSYPSPLGLLTLQADDEALLNIEFPDVELPLREGVRIIAAEEDSQALPLPLRETVNWLDSYFEGRQPDEYPPMRPAGSPFRQEVWERLCEIPFGELLTYGELARMMAEARGIPRMAAQAVGGAVGANPIPIIIPCHRVIGSNGSLTGYGGGVQFKVDLLEHEQVETRGFKWPKVKEEMI